VSTTSVMVPAPPSSSTISTYTATSATVPILPPNFGRIPRVDRIGWNKARLVDSFVEVLGETGVALDVFARLVETEWSGRDGVM
jgi:hypothetical protein